MHSNSGRGVFAGLHPSTADTPGGPDSLQLCVFGLPASLVVDGDAAAAAEAGHGLQAWDLDPDALVDRFDARLLLHTWPPPTPQPLVVHDTAASEAQVDHERYRDWHAATAAAADAEDEPSQQQRSPQVPALGPDTHPSSPGDSRPHPHQGPAFGFSYDTPSSQGGGSNQDGSAVAAAGAPEAGTSGAGGSSVGQQLVEEPWEPWFPLPVRLQDHLPASLQHNLVVYQTAKFVAAQGGQMEVVLRVKQGSHPRFAFLNPGDRVNPYYRWLVEGGLSLVGQHPPLPAPPAAPAVAPQPSSSSPTPALPASDAAGAAAVAAADPGGGNGSAAGTHALAMLRSYSATSHDDSQEPDTPTVTSAAATVGDGLAPTAGAAADAAPSVQQPQQHVAMATPRSDGSGKATSAGDSAPGSTAQQAAGPPGPPANKVVLAAPAQVAAAAAAAAGSTSTAMPVVPPDVAAIIAKLVAAVRKAGPQFEAALRRREANNPKFGFLNPGHMYHVYYQQQLNGPSGQSQPPAESVPAAAPAVPAGSAAAAPTPAAAAVSPACLSEAEQATPAVTAPVADKGAEEGMAVGAVSEQQAAGAAAEQLGMSEKQPSSDEHSAASGHHQQQQAPQDMVCELAAPQEASGGQQQAYAVDSSDHGLQPEQQQHQQQQQQQQQQAGSLSGEASRLTIVLRQPVKSAQAATSAFAAAEEGQEEAGQRPEPADAEVGGFSRGSSSGVDPAAVATAAAAAAAAPNAAPTPGAAPAATAAGQEAAVPSSTAAPAAAAAVVAGVAAATGVNPKQAPLVIGHNTLVKLARPVFPVMAAAPLAPPAVSSVLPQDAANRMLAAAAAAAASMAGIDPLAALLCAGTTTGASVAPLVVPSTLADSSTVPVEGPCPGGGTPELPSATEGKPGTSAAAAATVAGPAAADADEPSQEALKAQRRLKAKLLLAQRQAAQLAEQEAQEQEERARAILRHRQLLKQLRGDAGDVEDGHGGQEVAGPATAALAAAAGPARGPAEHLEEGEVQPEPATGSAEALAAAEAAAASHSSWKARLQRHEGPAVTVLPGLKELAVRAAQAGALAVANSQQAAKPPTLPATFAAGSSASAQAPSAAGADVPAPGIQLSAEVSQQIAAAAAAAAAAAKAAAGRPGSGRDRSSGGDRRASHRRGRSSDSSSSGSSSSSSGRSRDDSARGRRPASRHDDSRRQSSSKQHRRKRSRSRSGDRQAKRRDRSREGRKHDRSRSRERSSTRHRGGDESTHRSRSRDRSRHRSRSRGRSSKGHRHSSRERSPGSKRHKQHR